MYKHQVISSKMRVDVRDLLLYSTDEKKYEKFIVSKLKNEIMNNIEDKMLVTKKENEIMDIIDFRVELVVMNIKDYEKLSKVIRKLDIIIVDEDGVKKRLEEFL